MPSKQKFVINKVQSSNSQTDNPSSFPKMSQLYLELIENKDKIKPGLINKTHDYTKEIDSISEASEYEDKDRYKDNDRRRSSRDKYSSSEYSSSEYSSSDYSRSSRSSRSSRLSDRLANLLNEDDDKKQNIPTLEDLGKNGDVNMNSFLPDVEKIENEEDKKRELLFKFELLKKSYKGSTIPEYNINTDYSTMYNSYENTVRRLSVDSNVESYKTYLIGGCMLVEWLLGNFLKFDMKGFTQQQIVNMSSYEKLLVELGEKSYVPQSKQWPVEVRLMCLILFNAAMFIASKMLMKGTGSNLMNMMNNLSKNVTNPPTTKRKMKPPNMDDLAN